MIRIVLLFLLCLNFSLLNSQENINPPDFEVWFNAYNSDDLKNTTERLYHDQAYLHVEDQFFNRENLNDGLKILSGMVSISSHTFLSSTADSWGNTMVAFEVETPNTKWLNIKAYKNTKQGHRIEYEIWRKWQTNEIRNIPIIDRQRNNWVKHSNEHNPSALVETVYHSNGYYLNQGILSQGHKNITERYSYMSKKGWQISLSKNYLVFSSRDRAYELGTYKSTGEGKYLLIWEQNEDGNWKIVLDFNF